MKVLRYAVSCALALSLAPLLACGGATDGGDDSVSGAGGAGHAAGTGSISGGTTGLPSFGGTMNNPACPATAPATASACTLTGLQAACEYTGKTCACVRTGRNMPGMGGATSTATREWQCVETLVCPTTKPADGEACTATGTCRYSGMGSCNCDARTSKWACRGGTLPGAGGGGSGLGGGFSFGGTPGTGSAGAATGTTCPATKPVADTACTGTGACPYTGGGCVCSSDKWTCL